MGQGYEPQPQTQQGTGGGAAVEGGGQCGGWRAAARELNHPDGEAMMAPPPDPKAQKLIDGSLAKSKTLTGKIALEPGELERFRVLAQPLGAKVRKPDQLFLDARARYLAGDPRMHRLAGVALKENGTWPSAELVAAVCLRQLQTGLAVTGYPAVAQLAEWLGKSEGGNLELDRNDDLFGHVVARSDRDGKRPEDPSKRALYRAHREPFLGVGWKPGSGVNDAMYETLMRAEDALLGAMGEAIDRDPGRAHPAKGAPLTKTREDLRYWVGIREQHWGYKSGAAQGYHKTGSAMDLNYHTNPWMAVRTGATVGGEAATAGQKGMSIEAIDVIDRAMLWMTGRRAELHIANRPPGTDPVELGAWAKAVVERFEEASDAVASYFALAFAVDRDQKRAELTRENQRIVAEREAGGGPKGEDPEGRGALIAYKSILSALPRRADADAVERIEGSMGCGRPWSRDPKVVLARMGPDLQAVARVMVRGNVSTSPAVVRDPTLGLFDLKQELVQALVGAGLHWGGCEFGGLYSGDMMHFDLGRVPPELK